MKKIITIIVLMWLIVLSGIELNDEGSLLGVLYHQTAAEYRAICYQAYNLAGDRLVELLAEKEYKSAAIIVDVDETVLTNSVYNAREVVKAQHYPEDFYRWIEDMSSEPVSGAREFLLLADSLNVKIYYITNRRDHKKEATRGNLVKHGFPQAENEQILCKTRESSKEPRRQQVMQEHEVLLLIGDNLIDFADCFGEREVESRFAAVEKWQEEFGRRFIILPNIMHGMWLKVINDFEYNLSGAELKAKRLEHLEY